MATNEETVEQEPMGWAAVPFRFLELTPGAAAAPVVPSSYAETTPGGPGGCF